MHCNLSIRRNRVKSLIGCQSIEVKTMESVKSEDSLDGFYETALLKILKHLHHHHHVPSSLFRFLVISWTKLLYLLLSCTSSFNSIKSLPVTSFKLSSHLILCLPLFLFPSHFPTSMLFSKLSLLVIMCPK